MKSWKVSFCEPRERIRNWGDIKVFHAALNGVAMLFGSGGSSLFASDSSVTGLGQISGLALLIGLLVMLLGGLINQKVDVGGWFVALIIFIVMAVPKFDVQIESFDGADNQAVAKVDNVPAGIAIPAVFVSTIAIKVVP